MSTPQGPERTQPRQNQNREQDNVLSPQAVAEIFNITPDKAEAAMGILQNLFERGGRAQAHELTTSQRREETQYNISPEGLAKDILGPLDINQIPTNLAPIFREIESKDRSKIIPKEISEWLGKFVSEYISVKDTDPAAAGRIQQIIERLRGVAETYSMGRDELGVMTFSLTGEEIRLMTSGLDGARQALEGWVSEIEKTSYSSEEDTNRTFFNRYSAAIGWLPLLAQKYTNVVINGEVVTDPKKIRNAVDQLIKEYRARIHIHNMKWAIETTDWKIVQGISNNMGSASLFEGFHLKNVSTALNLYQRFFDRYRFAYGTVVKKKDEQGKVIETGPTGVTLWRITPEDVAQIKQKVINELDINKEFYGIASRDEAVRAANIGLNLFSASMREGVHVARGLINRPDMDPVPGYDRSLRKEPSFQSDPNEILTNLYNPLQFQIEKWTRFGEPQKAILNKILLFLGKGDIHTGRQEFNNLLSIVDYFSSGWRIENIYQATVDRLKHFNKTETDAQRKERLNSLSTGLLLQKENPFIKDDPKKPEERGENLRKGKERLRTVAKYRPLELLKAYSVTIDQEGNEYSTDKKGDQQGRHKKFQALLQSGNLKTTGVTEGGGITINNYVRLEEVLGRYIYPIYERAMQRGWDKIHGIDIGKAGSDPSNPFDAEDKQLIVETVNRINAREGYVPEDQKLSVEDLQSIYKQLQEFLLEEKTIDDLATNPRQAHLYDRALYVDDAPLGKLEVREEKEDGDIVPISVKLFTIEAGRREPYARMWGDTASSAVVIEHGMNAMISRDPESLMKELHEAMAAQTGYAGRPPYIKFLYSIGEGWLKLAKADSALAFFSLHNRLPIASSEFEKLFGLAAPSMAPQELRQLYEKMQLILGKPETEPGGKDIDKRIREGLGIEGYKIAFVILTKIALIILIFTLQEQLKDLEKEE